MTEVRRSKPRAIVRAYALWLLGVFSAAAAAYFLYRSRLVSYEVELDADDGGGVDLEHLHAYTDTDDDAA